MNKYCFPEESVIHEGTWLIWPHEYHFADTKAEGKKSLSKIENIWVAMTKVLHEGENVHIVAYYDKDDKKDNPDKHKSYIKKQLEKKGAMTNEDIDKIEFVPAKTDSFWIRDIGPMFVYDENNKLTIADFAFDSWGETTDEDGNLFCELDDALPRAVHDNSDIPIVSIPELVLEGGAFEIDGEGTLLACESSVNSVYRNLDLSRKEVDDYLKKYLGVTNIIWLKGFLDDDITNGHIDGLARFYDSKTIITLPEDCFYEGDFKKLKSARNAKGEKYKIIELPLTTINQWWYINYYIGNSVILLPTCGGRSEKGIVKKLSELYATKQIVPIDVTRLIQHGGAIHCITQQQPIAKD